MTPLSAHKPCLKHNLKQWSQTPQNNDLVRVLFYENETENEGGKRII